jgi:uncharacterized protein YecT (DUF1311 family)
MRISRYVVIATKLIVLACLPLFAVAQAPQGSTECSSATTTATMRTCENARYQRAEKELKANYAELAKQLDPAGKEKLIAAQTAWVRFRDSNAEFQANIAKGGTLAPVIKMTVLADMTEARTAELKRTLQLLRGGGNWKENIWRVSIYVCQLF